MSPIGVDKGLTSGSHGAHQAVDSGHVDGGPDLPDGLLQLGCGRWPRLEGIQLPLHNVPQVFNGIHIRAQRGPGHHPDVVLLQEGCTRDFHRLRAGHYANSCSCRIFP